MLDLMEQRDAREAQQRAKKLENRKKNTTPSLDLEDYTGNYGGEVYGDAVVELQNGSLVVQFVPSPKFRGELSHWHFDTFEITFKQFPSLPSGTCTFVLNADGEVDEMIIDVPNPDFDFTELDFKKKN